MEKKELVCETCGDVVEEGYNAMMKTPLWNCEECYQAKRATRVSAAGSDAIA